MQRGCHSGKPILRSTGVSDRLHKPQRKVDTYPDYVASCQTKSSHGSACSTNMGEGKSICMSNGIG